MPFLDYKSLDPTKTFFLNFAQNIIQWHQNHFSFLKLCLDKISGLLHIPVMKFKKKTKKENSI